MGASVAQEYYKVQDSWKQIDPDKKWRLAIWVLDYHDVEIVDKFMTVESSPLGKFDDIFFHFDTVYKGDDGAFSEALFKEYVSWFEKPVDDKEPNMLEALKNEGLLLEDYKPDDSLKPTIGNLWREMLRFKSCIKGLENFHFCAYFQVGNPEAQDITSWYRDVLKQGVPQGIRLATIDYKDKRKVKISSSSQVIHLSPKLNMAEALANELEKGSFSNDTVGIDGRYRKQILTVLKCSQDSKSTKLNKEIQKLLEISKEMTDVSSVIGTYLVVSQAYYYVRNDKKCAEYSDKAIQESEKLMETHPNLYPIWRGAMMLKAATYMGNKKRGEAMKIYERLAEESVKRADAFYIMESYRLIGHIHYDLGQLEDAFENSLLALAAGGYLEQEVRRNSTFPQVANLSLHLCEKIHTEKETEVLKEQLKEFLGNDWESLVQNENIDKVQVRNKTSFLNF